MHSPSGPALASAMQGGRPPAGRPPSRIRGRPRRAVRRTALAALLALAAFREERVLRPAFFGEPQPHAKSREPPPRRPWPRTSPGGSLSAWEVLEVSPGAAKEDIKLAYLKKAKTEHPDRRPEDKDAVEKFIRINAAYKELMEGPSKALLPDANGASPSAAPKSASAGAVDDDEGNVYLAGVASSFVVVLYFGLFESSERLPLAAYILSIWLAVLALIPSKKTT